VPFGESYQTSRGAVIDEYGAMDENRKTAECFDFNSK
jgi:hypothetical protein